ncbi:MAG: sulfite oxidase-like oxidoreductase [Alphaproteobacteria bacterium GM7ARS4]|nr:sulfite oxidase-like oxidoreductase [Alphaproteobacteria bacterium GM7ARS4]
MINRDKLIGIKRLWASKEQHRSKQRQDEGHESMRLPPGQRLVKNWPVLDLGTQPSISQDGWRLRIGGLVETPLSMDWGSLHEQNLVETVSDMHCVTTWSRYDNHWRGWRTKDMLSLVKPKAQARFVMVVSYDGYKTNVPVAALENDQSLLVISWEGKPLTREHGGPVRLLIPHLYLWKSAKWIKEITFMADDQRGFWESNGYHNRADPWREERYASQE